MNLENTKKKLEEKRKELERDSKLVVNLQKLDENTQTALNEVVAGVKTLQNALQETLEAQTSSLSPISTKDELEALHKAVLDNKPQKGKDYTQRLKAMSDDVKKLPQEIAKSIETLKNALDTANVRAYQEEYEYNREGRISMIRFFYEGFVIEESWNYAPINGKPKLSNITRRVE